MKAKVLEIKKQAVGYNVSLFIPKAKKLEKLDINQHIDIEIEQLKQKRSLSQNSYAWVLISKIAETLSISKDEVYIQMLKSYGQSSMIAIKKDVSKTFERTQKYYEKIEEKDNMVIYQLLVGSSLYNHEEMSQFINGVVYEAQSLDIETLTNEQIATLKLL